MPETYTGKLRCRVRCLPGDGDSPARVEVAWFDPDQPTDAEPHGRTVWTETAAVTPGRAAVMQVQGEGTFAPVVPYFVDDRGLRHFVLTCRTGSLAGAFGG